MKLFFTQIEPPPVEVLDGLKRKGWQPLHLPFRRVHMFDQVALPDLTMFSAVILSSKYAARWFLKHAPGKPWPPFAIVGGATAAIIEAAGGTCLLPPAPHAEALVAAVRQKVESNEPLLFLHGSRVSPAIPAGLADRQLVRCTVYETTKIVPNMALNPDRGMVYFQAPSALEDFKDLFDFRPQHLAVIGPSTAKAASEAGWEPDFQPSRPELTCFARELPNSKQFEG